MKNIMKILSSMLVFYLFIFCPVYGQNELEVEFSLKKLEDIASQFPTKYLVEQDTIMLCPEISMNKSVVILHNEKRQISHLGISLFSKETKEIINKPVCDFVERLFLEFALAEDQNSIINMLQHNNIIMHRNGVNFGEGNFISIETILKEIEDPVYFTLKQERESYIVVWEYGLDDLLVINFPSNRELILGTNKIESDNLLHDQLISDNNCLNVFDLKERLSDDYKLTSSDGVVFVNKGDTFMIKTINEDTYYKKSGKGYDLIYDKKFPKESFSNLVFGHLGNKNLKIHVKHSMYGNFSPEFEMNFADFICFFNNDFKIFTASRLQESGELNSTIIFRNKQYNYIHLLIIKTTKECIFSENGVITASFHSNIPQHNIKNLLKDWTISGL